MYKTGLMARSKQIAPELKQSINGAYRIVCHRIQKELRKEYNSEQLFLQRKQREAQLRGGGDGRGYYGDRNGERGSFELVRSSLDFFAGGSGKRSPSRLANDDEQVHAQKGGLR